MNDNSVVEQVVSDLIQAGLADDVLLEGCTEGELRKLEDSYEVALPKVYRNFLKTMGKSAGAFMEGSDFLYESLFGLRADAEHLLEDMAAQGLLSKTDFVFLGHQGYEFLYFEIGITDDPPVYLLSEDIGNKKQLVFERFSEWLKRCVSDEIAAHRKIK